MAKVCINIEMGLYFKGSLKRARDKARANLLILKVILLLKVYGKMTNYRIKYVSYIHMHMIPIFCWIIIIIRLMMGTKSIIVKQV